MSGTGIDFEVDGVAYRLFFTPDAFCKVKGLLGLPSGETNMSEMGFTKLRKILKLGLEMEHPELSLMDVGNLIDGLGYGPGIEIVRGGLRNFQDAVGGGDE